MHKKYGPDDFAAVSVNLDDPADKSLQEKVSKFLEKQKAIFTNLVLDEQPDVWQEKLKFDGPPSVFVFNQEGKLAKQFKDEFKYAEVEDLVKELLKTK